MRKLVTLVLLAGLLFAGKTGQAQEKAKWAEMTAFHSVMSQTFHPAEEGKFEPIRTRSQEMVDKAVAWKASTAPEGYDKKAVKSNLKSLVKGAKGVNALVKKNAPDAEIKEALTKLHDVFHSIVEKCEKGDEKEGEHHM